MIDPKLVREHPEIVRKSLADRNRDTGLLDLFEKLDGEWKGLIEERNKLNRMRKESAIEVSKLEGERKARAVEEARRIAERLRRIEEEISSIEKKRDEVLLMFPNIPSSTTPVGRGEEENIIVEMPKGPLAFDFKPRPHYEICQEIGILDLKRGAKIAGSGFYVLEGEGAELERALINYMLDTHSRQGYREIQVPVAVRGSCAYGTGQMPEKKEDMYWIEGEDMLLNPTAEVPLTNLFADEILARDDLPINIMAALRSFRKEAGRHVDLKGIGRVHEFNKVELVKIVEEEHKQKELKRLLSDAEEIVRGLGLPYRIKQLCTGDLGFASEETYDIEVHAPGIDSWLEVSSCSSFSDFQSRRAHIKYRREPHLKSEFPVTLNGSGLALPRTFIGVVENYQRADGSIGVPEVLIPYMKGKKRISGRES